MKKRKNKSKLQYLLYVVLLVMTVGFAYLSTTLGINGIAGIKGNTFDIHWDGDSIEPSDGSVTPKVAATVSDEKQQNIDFTVDFELPGDFYEFTVDAVNDGGLDGELKSIVFKFYDHETGEELDSLPEYYVYSLTHADGSEIEPGEVLLSGDRQGFKFRIEYDKRLTSIPEGDKKPVEIEVETKHVQPNPELYTVIFDPNGGVVGTSYKKVNKGDKIGTLPKTTKDNGVFIGWYTELSDGEMIGEEYKPTSNKKVYAHWSGDYTMFDTGNTVNKKLKMLAGNVVDEENPKNTEDTNITTITKSTTKPDINSMTDTNILSTSDSPTPIYAWYEDGVIYWWSEADKWLNPDSSNMFNNLKSLKTLDTTFNTSTSTNMNGMFAGLRSIEVLDLSNFDTSNVTNMGGMFSKLSGISSLDISNFDVSKVTSMDGMFSVSDLQHIYMNGWNTENLTSMGGMFSYCTSLKDLDLSSFDISNVTVIGGIFSACTNLESLDISGWNFAKTEVGALFAGLSQLKTINLNNVNTSKVTSMGGLFSGCGSLLNVDLSSFDISNVTSIGGMFNQCYALKTINISGWNFAKTDMNGLFNGLSALTDVNLNGVNTSTVTGMSGLFNNCNALTYLDLSDFDTRNVTNMANMFQNCYYLKTILVSDNFVVTQVTSDSNMFNYAWNLEGGNGTTYSSSHIDKEYAHYDYGTTNPGYFNRGDTNIYTVTFNAEGGIVEPSFKSVRGNTKIGDLPKPTYKAHVFEGWYTEDNTLIENTFKVTSDVTLHAHWRDAESYTVTFNPNGGVTQETSRVVYEDEEIGEFPTVTRENYYLHNWHLGTADGIIIDASYKPTSDITVVATWKVDFADAPVSVISEIAKEDNLCIDFNVGDTREVEMNGKTNVLQISNCTYNELYNARSKTQSANGLVIEFANGIGQHRMNSWNSSSGNVNGNGIIGGWEYSEMRQYLNTTIYDSLPAEWKSAIIDTRVISGRSMLDSDNFITLDKLYLLSPGEVFGTDGGDGKIHDKAASADRQLDFYSDNGYWNVKRRWDSGPSASQKARKGVNYEDYHSYLRQIDWWLRNVDYADSGHNSNGGYFGTVHSVTASSAWYTSSSSSSDGSGVYSSYEGLYSQISPAFRIGTEDAPVHTITLNYNDDETDSSTVSVVDGKNIGTLPEPTRDGYTFDGWYTGITDGTEITTSYVPDGNIPIYAHWTEENSSIPDPVSFSTDSWETIKKAVDDSNTSKYKVGDRKDVTVTMDFNNDGEAEEKTFKVRIVNIVRNATCRTEGFSQSACGIIVEFESSVFLHRMNPSGSSAGQGNRGGWPSSELRTYLNTDFYNALPEGMQAAIRDTFVVSGYGKGDTANYGTSTDKIFLLSAKELGYDSENEDSDSKEKTRTLDWYNSNSSSSFKLKKYNTNNYYYWLRTAYKATGTSGNTSSFLEVNYNAALTYYNAYETSRGVAPAFRIGYADQ